MVHICCLAEDCRRVIHLSDSSYWNYKGPVRCPKCGAKMKVQIRDGEVILLKQP